MPEKFKNKYRIPSARWSNWDYGWNAAYFITICTKDMECLFGYVKDSKMFFSNLGTIANDCWSQIPDHFPFVKLGNFIVMPNHVHGIVIFDKPGNEHNAVDVIDMSMAGIQDFASLPAKDIQNVPLTKNQFGPQSQNLASVVRGFKTGVTINARKIRDNFAWQPRYHDHVIRNNEAYLSISDYIENNPASWQTDRFHMP